MLLAIVTSIGPLIAIVGAVLMLYAISEISTTVGDRSIFRNMVVAVALAVVGLVIGVATVLSSVLRAFGLGILSGGVPNPSSIPHTNLVDLIMGAIVGFAVLWVLLIVSAYFVRLSYDSMGSKLGVSMFGTAGLLYLIGAALTIILVGLVLIFVALILNIVAFFSIPDQPPSAQPGPPSRSPSAPPPSSPGGQTLRACLRLRRGFSGAREQPRI